VCQISPPEVVTTHLVALRKVMPVTNEPVGLNVGSENGSHELPPLTDIKLIRLTVPGPVATMRLESNTATLVNVVKPEYELVHDAPPSVDLRMRPPIAVLQQKAQNQHHTATANTRTRAHIHLIETGSTGIPAKPRLPEKAMEPEPVASVWPTVTPSSHTPLCARVK
jgi:hypothetical protein